MKDNSDSQFFYKILNGINSNIRIIDVEANKSVYMSVVKRHFRLSIRKVSFVGK